jgi:hypothetical protein
MMKGRGEEPARAMKQNYKDMVQLFKIVEGTIFLFQNFHF